MNRFVILLVLVIAILLGTVFFLAKYHKDQIKEILFTQINKYLNTAITFEDYDIDMKDNFPKISFELYGVYALGKDEEEDLPLVDAETVSVLFDAWQILTGNFQIQDILIKNADINLLHYKNGSNNYMIFKSSESESKNIELEKVFLENCNVFYQDIKNQFSLKFLTKDIFLSGNIMHEEISFKTSGKLLFHFLKSKSENYLVNKELQFDAKMSYANSVNTLNISECSLMLEKIPISIHGKINFSDHFSDFDIELSSFDIMFSTIKKETTNFLPSSFLSYDIDGKTSTILKIKGKLSNKKNPEIKADFSFSNGKLNIEELPLSLNSINFNGTFSNGGSRIKDDYHFTLSGFTAKSKSGIVTGKLDIQNFNHPFCKVNIEANMDMEEVLEIWKLDTLDSVNGSMNLVFQFSKKLNSLNAITINDFINSKTEGQLDLNNISFQLKESPLTYENFSGKFFFNNNNLLVNHLNGDISGTDFQMEGIFLNILSYWFLPDERLKVIADFSSNEFRFDDLIEKGNKKNEESYHFSLPRLIDCELNVTIDHFSFRKFNANNITGKVNLNSQKLTVSNIQFQSMNGENTISGMLNEIDKDNFDINCQADFEGVNIQQLFGDFEDFGQNYFTHQHVRGRLNTKIFYQASMHSDLTFDISRHYVSADVSISDGEIIDYPPLYALADFIHFEQLQHVYFSKLENSIEIKNQIITIPDMEINSSSLHLMLNGTHSFSNEIDYHLLLRLSDLVKEPDDLEREFLIKEEESDRLYIPIRMTGNADNPDIKYDWKGARQRISNSWKEEQDELKHTLKKEIGWIMGKESEDTLVKEVKSKVSWENTSPNDSTDLIEKKDNNFEKNDADFIFIWDEEEDADTLDYN